MDSGPTTVTVRDWPREGAIVEAQLSAPIEQPPTDERPALTIDLAEAGFPGLVLDEPSTWGDIHSVETVAATGDRILVVPRDYYAKGIHAGLWAVTGDGLLVSGSASGAEFVPTSSGYLAVATVGTLMEAGPQTGFYEVTEGGIVEVASVQLTWTLDDNGQRIGEPTCELIAASDEHLGMDRVAAHDEFCREPIVEEQRLSG